MPTPDLSSPPVEAHDAVAPLVRCFEHLDPHHLGDLADLYAPDARFKDPFNDVQGVAAIQAIFAHMFRALADPRFVVTEQVCEGRQCFLCWELRFRFHSDASTMARTVRGASHLRFDTQGRVCWHRDYWDAAEELYEQWPVLGPLMRWLRRRVARA